MLARSAMPTKCQPVHRYVGWGQRAPFCRGTSVQRPAKTRRSSRPRWLVCRRSYPPPVVLLETFRGGLRDWSASGTFPQAWRHARVICLPKDAVHADCREVRFASLAFLLFLFPRGLDGLRHGNGFPRASRFSSSVASKEEKQLQRSELWKRPMSRKEPYC